MKAVNFLRKLLGNLLKRQKNKESKPAPDITGLNKEHHRDVVWRPVSPWSKRRWPVQTYKPSMVQKTIK